MRERILAAGALLALAAAGVLIVLVGDLRDSSNSARQPEEAIAAAYRLEALVLDLETGERGFIITRQERYLEPWQAALAAFPGQAAALERLVSDDPLQEPRAQAITHAFSAYVDDYARPLVATARRHPGTTGSVTALGEDGHRVDAIRVQLASLISAEDTLAATRRDRASSAATRAIGIGTAGLVGALVLILLLAGYLTRAIVTPVKRLSAAAVLLAGGDLAVRVPVTGTTEVAELGRAFNEMADTLEESRDEVARRAAEAEQTKSELVATVSHELRTPLSSVVGYTELLVTKEVDDVTRARYLEIVHREAERLAELIDDFLDLQSIEAGGFSLQREPVELGELLRKQVELVSGQTAGNAPRLIVPEEPLTVVGDSGRIGQTIGNLLSNAIKYSPDGGAIDVTATANGDFARVAVRDRGLGIPASQQRFIFEKFFRADTSDTREIGGTGLGLALCKELVEAQGGRIGFESVEGEGSTFWFELPSSVMRQDGGNRPPIVYSSLHMAIERPEDSPLASEQTLMYAQELRELYGEERTQRSRAEQALAGLEDSYTTTVRALAAALELRDDQTGGHASRVAALALELARRVDPELMADRQTEYGFLLHDIGKIGLSDGILLKPGKLDTGERAEMECHPALGSGIIAQIPYLSGTALQIVAAHHERWDGLGYPNGLRGEQIPLAARIFALADTFDAMTNDRPYRRALTVEQALAEIERCAGTQFDPAIVATFLSLAPELLSAA